jgi:hypothetical protein
VTQRRRPQVLLLAALLLAAISGCGGGHAKPSSSGPAPSRTSAIQTNVKPAKPKPGRGRRFVPNPRRAAVERTVTHFVQGVERSDSVRVCKLLGRPAGTLEGCARAAGIDLHSVPSSAELSVARISFRGSRATAILSGGQTFALRRAGRRWLISGLRP